MKRSRTRCLQQWWAIVALGMGVLGALVAPALADGGIGASVRGPVNEVTPLSDSSKEVIVIGRSVLVDRGLTEFQDQTGAGFGFDTLAVNDLVWLHGTVAAGNQIWADRVVKLGQF